MSNKRVAILISGGGSNMVSLVQSMQGDHNARAVLVLTNNPQAQGVMRAQEFGVQTAVVDHRPFQGDRHAFEAALQLKLEAAQTDIICLAGFMRILTAEFIQNWAGRMINVHPSLLPKYRGLQTHARALDAGDSEHGCSVHEVTAELDEGPILGQSKLSIKAGETSDSLAARVLALEHELYAAVLRRFANGDKSPLFLS
ncbi:MAG: phosphoribosylglycinamide formyltransferase-1 [Paracoccaceae bacterium]